MKPDIACANHPDSEGFFQCRYCGENFCERCCRRMDGDFYLCAKADCQKAYQTEASAPPKLCPHCGVENSPFADICSFCGRKMSNSASGNPNSPATVAKFRTVNEANLARTKLQNHGIEAFVADEAISAIYDLGSGFLGGIRVQVRADDFKKAQEALELNDIRAEDSSPLDQVTGICRYCRDHLPPVELKEELGILHCLKPPCLDAFQKEVKSLGGFCPSCGVELSYPASYCTNCGKKLGKNPTTIKPEWVVTSKSIDAKNLPAPSGNPIGACRYCGEIMGREEANLDAGPLHCNKTKCLEAYRAEMKSLARPCPSCGASIAYPDRACSKCGARVPEIELGLEPGEKALLSFLPGGKCDFRWAFLLWLFIYALKYLPIMAYVGVQYGKGLLPDSSSIVRIFGMGYMVSLVLIWFWTRQLLSLSWKGALEFLGFKSPHPGQLLAAAVICFPILTGHFLAFQQERSEGVLLLWKENWGSELVFILLGAGLFEETLYRGFLFRLLRRNRDFLSATFLSSALWALSHLSHLIPLYGPKHEGFHAVLVLMFQVLVDGFLAAYLFERAGNNIWGWMLVHVANDWTRLLTTAGSDWFPSSRALDLFDASHLVAVLLTVPVAIWLLPPGKKREPDGLRAEGNTTPPPSANEWFRRRRAFFIPLTLAPWVCIIFFLVPAQQLSEKAKDNDWKKMLDAHPRYADGYRRWAYDLWEREKDDEAMQRCAEALEIDPQNYKAWLQWGEILTYHRGYGNAAEKFQKAADYAPRNAAVYVWWGYALEELGKKEAAIGKYRNVIALNPDETYFVSYARQRIDRLEGKQRPFSFDRYPSY